VQAEELGDELRAATGDAEGAPELLPGVGHVTRTPSPLRCGRARYNSNRVNRIWGLPSIKMSF
jgi:hypothetical protein